jgi:putative endonuclease
MPHGLVYILASQRNGTLYIGVTNNLTARIHAHRKGHGSGFTKKYKVTMLVWYESYDMMTDAIQRETALKRWKRNWKLALIEETNPDWNDLYDSLAQGWIGGSSPPRERFLVVSPQPDRLPPGAAGWHSAGHELIRKSQVRRPSLPC